jgi:hypothetical protein
MIVKQFELVGAGMPTRNDPFQRWNELSTRIAY